MKVNFEVGAKAARLIGRENIADVDGALMELIKNAYDADASCVYVRFNMPFPYVPSFISSSDFAKKIDESTLSKVIDYYEIYSNGLLKRKPTLTNEEKEDLRKILFSYNKILVIDNGTGMNMDTVKQEWMYIGTSNKENEAYSKGGRIKTGSKGIGRFALDKLSLSTQMYTKCEESNLISWHLDWEQFTNSKLLKDISADIDIKNIHYKDLVRELLGDSFNEIEEDHNWDTGTVFVLHPTRDEWSERLFQKVNTNLKSINPLGSADKFDVHIQNAFYPQYKYITEEVAIDSNDFDYRIKAEFDGQETLTVKLLRNEVDLKKKSIFLSSYSKSILLNEFWTRPFFQEKAHSKEDYEKEIKYSINIVNYLKNEDIDKMKGVGPFKSEIYFLKSDKSDYEIIKTFKVKNRKELLNKFSGIKLYRDKFKVRPYGDEGTLYDWTGLGKRAQDSPGGVASQSGSWRVLPYQIIGQVNISRFANESLVDMANREGLTQNETYFIFLNILQIAFRIFEMDRQSFYREYAKWITEIEERISIDEKIKAEAKKKVEERRSADEGNKETDNNNAYGKNNESNRFTEEQYQNTVYNMIKKGESEINAKQILELLSSSGLILNTFFHEFRAISTQFGARAPQLRKRIDHLLGGEEYKGSLAYDPYIIIDAMQNTDVMLELWLDVAMQGIEKESLKRENISLRHICDNLIDKWEKLLKSKDISIEFIYDNQNDYCIEVSVADIYIIINNFLLNSVWFLEKNENDDRKIVITMIEEEGYIQIKMENNGPALDEKFRVVPNRIFELGETSKGDKEGTGVGLWVMREAVNRNNGSVYPIEKNSGFGIKVMLKK